MSVKSETARGAGCLMLFALPFAVVGVGALGMVVWTLATWVSMQSWQEVPAHIERADLVSSHSDKSTTYSVEAGYSYEWNGQQYHGDRVSMYASSDNVGSFNQRVAEELAEYRDQGLSFRCYVNPNNPADAVLYRNARVELLGFMMLFGLVFGGAGFGIMAAAVYGVRSSREQEALQMQYPGEPWRWRKDWEKGVISAHTMGKMVAAFVFAIFWNLISSPILFFVPGEVLDGNYAALIGLLFPLVGVGALAVAVYLALRWRRYGNTVFEMAAVPGVIGGQLHGRVCIPSVVLPEEDVRAALDCVNSRTTGTGKQRSTTETILWQAETAIPRGDLVQDGRATVIPLWFAIPGDQPPTDDSDTNNKFLWRLRVEAATPGVDFAANFEVPVFHTEESAAFGAGPASVDGPEVIELDGAGRPVAGSGLPGPAQTGEILRKAGVLTEPCTGGGVALVFPMLRQPGTAFGMLAFTAVWGGAVALMWHVGVPWFFSGIFGLALLLLIYGTLDLFAGKSRIEVSRTGILVRGGLFGLGPARQLSFDEVAGFDIKRTMQAGNRLYYSVQLKKQDGKALRIADRLRQEEANAVIQAIETTLRDYR